MIVENSNHKESLTWATFCVFYLPFLLAYQVAALLVITNQRRFARLAFLPFALWSACRLVVFVWLGRQNDPRFDYWNHGNLLMVASVVLRIVGWTFTNDTYQRVDWSGSCLQLSTRHTLFDAFELCNNTRGIGWNWGKGIPIPVLPRSPPSYVWRLCGTVLLQTILFDLIHTSAKLLLPRHTGGSIYDPSLPFIHRYTLSSSISFLLGLMIYLFIDTSYSLVALAAIVLFDNHTSSWPPIFDSPWLSDSLANFWGSRWHQVFRHIFLSAAGRPLSLLFGQAGLVMGTFFTSGVVHALGVWGMGKGVDFMRVCGFFLMMGVGIIVERWWHVVTGYRVSGWLGRIWTYSWVVGWSNMMFDVWGSKGMIDSVFLPPYLQASSLL